MFFANKYCPTCKKYDREFRMLEGREWTGVEPRHRGRTDLWRCTAVGCRWYQPVHHQRDGGRLLEEFRNPAADPPA
ncbi:hypothetical protein DI272_32825 [Streptomyces sp. Act143]|uniref:hypothetical protein n=1 Tax=Streptomyces sp. Act143 TaxID=2200760 RepID=UPI000D67EDFD|nr:hypothetical protein [Streptomyces sp. Act143]PWI18395.1 hypothetical protein DI272_32825 [Streptomyces sp. Act143]